MGYERVLKLLREYSASVEVLGAKDEVREFNKAIKILEAQGITYELPEEVKKTAWNCPEISDAWNRWCRYRKDQLRKTYKSKDSALLAIRRLWNLSKGNIEIAVKIVDQSICNQYQGLFELKENGKIESTRLGEKHTNGDYKF